MKSISFARVRRLLLVTPCAMLFALLVFSPNPAAADTTGWITGKVLDEQGRPVRQAVVIILGKQMGAMTGWDGVYRIPNVPAGSYTLRARQIGYKPDDKAVQVLYTQTTTVDFVIQRNRVISEVVPHLRWPYVSRLSSNPCPSYREQPTRGWTRRRLFSEARSHTASSRHTGHRTQPTALRLSPWIPGAHIARC